LLDPDMGATVCTMQVDLMHTLYLGCAQDWCARSIWSLILADIYRVGANRTQEEQIQLSVLRLRSDLMQWYREQRGKAPPDFTQMEDLPLSLLGSKRKQTFKSKAAECKSILPFVLLMLRGHEASLEAATVQPLIAAGEAVLAFIRVVRDSPTRPTVPQCQARGALNRCMSRGKGDQRGASAPDLID